LQDGVRTNTRSVATSTAQAGAVTFPGHSSGSQHPVPRGQPPVVPRAGIPRERERSRWEGASSTAVSGESSTAESPQLGAAAGGSHYGEH